MLLGCFVIGACCLFSARTVRGDAMSTERFDMDYLARLFDRAAEATDIPWELFAAIAAQESSFHPWSVNLAGRSFFARSKQEALDSIGDTKSYDLGLMQINSMWLPRLGVSNEDALDPVMNVMLGATILNDCIQRYGTEGGIACYHAGSPNKRHGILYAQKVIAKWRLLKNTNSGQDKDDEKDSD